MNKIVSFSLIFGVMSVFGQGSLTPPGAPAPTMKTLDQLEARTPIESLPYVISEGGSYYLTKNLTMPDGVYSNGIQILTNGVSVDLNGFTVTGGTGNQSGIGVPLSGEVYKNIRVQNGFVQNWSKNGVDLLAADNSVVVDICTVSNLSSGIQLGNNGRVVDCATMLNRYDGIYVYDGTIVQDCTSRENGRDGIRAYRSCVVRDSLCVGNGVGLSGAGIFAVERDNRIEANHVLNNNCGLRVDGDGNMIVRNTASGNTQNWDVAASNVCQVIQATASGAISGDSGGSSVGSTDPYVNFTF